MVNKLVVSLILVLMLLGVAIYFRVEFKYKMVAEGQNTQILKDLKAVFQETQSLNENRLDKVIQIAEEHKIGFATDFQLLDTYLLKSCIQDCLNELNYYQSLRKLIELVNLKKMWVVRKNWSKDKVAYFIQEQEVTVIKNTLLKRRSLIADKYKNLPSYELKEAALSTINVLDEKIKELQKK